MAFTAADVKTLRERTSVGMMDCKKALTACDGDMEKAIEWLREKGLAKAIKKAGRIAAEGMAYATVQGNIGTVVEVNCETDFCAKSAPWPRTARASCLWAPRSRPRTPSVRRLPAWVSSMSTPAGWAACSPTSRPCAPGWTA